MLRPLSLPTFAQIHQRRALHNPLSTEYYKDRLEQIMDHGFVDLSVEQADCLAAYLRGTRVLELGAGLGYLAAALHERGIDVTAYDTQEDTYQHLQWSEDKRFFPVQCVDALSLSAYDADVVILVWHSYDTPFAYQVAQRLRPGQTLLYLGEPRSGCTASADFFDWVESTVKQDAEAEFKLNQFHLPYYGILDRWWVCPRWWGSTPI